MIVVKVTTAPSPPCPRLSVVLVTAILTVTSTNIFFFHRFPKASVGLRIVDLLENGNCHVNGELEVQGVVVKVDTTGHFNELEESLSDENAYASLVRFFIRSSL